MQSSVTAPCITCLLHVPGQPLDRSPVSPAPCSRRNDKFIRGSLANTPADYARSDLYRAKPEALRILKRFGDPAPWIEKTGVMGIAVAHACLDNREVIKHCRALWESEPQNSFSFAIKRVPVDYWCETRLEAMKAVIDSHIKDRIGENQTWGMKVYKHRWQQYHSIEIIEFLAADIPYKVDLRNPDWLLYVNVVGKATALSLLKPEEVFSIGRPCP